MALESVEIVDSSKWVRASCMVGVSLVIESYIY
jgi:hypothetical protein